MSHLIMSNAHIAGHCTKGTSNKIWVACVAVEQDGDARPVDLATVPASTEVVFLCGHGPYGAALRLEEPKKMSRQAAQNLLRKKWQEKAEKGYAAVAFEPFLASFGKPWGLPLLLPGAVSSANQTSAISPLETREASTEETPPLFRQTAALVKAVTFDEMMALFREGYTASEKANGERFMYHQKSPLWAFTAESSEAFL